jgi:hypothetical protein
MKRLVLFLLCLALAASPVPASAQSSGVYDWARVRAIDTGRPLVVNLKGGQTASGAFELANDGELQLRVAGSNDLRRVPRADIVTVESAPNGKEWVVGAVIGAAVGGAIGGLAFKPITTDDVGCGSNGCGNRVITGYGLVIGLPILGGLLGGKIASSSRRRVIYRGA